ncbi:MAG: NAD(P)H-dependent oxidoreductase [Candidatus Pacebacteria bacterium]|nr:NAD(P)H-dependent oxidoreductase [Candidatus Paceibacterota bacterium]MDD3729176.1 NAD(P)H-dependent oxidoreductase [Candidatus Paceibacterota bacterium]MDD4201833.1 NAD(P)H-dependent oxidoreductase [Candidatus Paceibacterota bacterium]MDD4897743.1 NAD(P)H-dependent oxidoreductase [Candidatus Paceibacterota bacterium]MDD5445949.1 NAD(P)H-dependent oxidoreductase [Candidatus Paceibacterota bacterium]
MYIPVILGTGREGRRSEKAADFMLKKVLEKGIESEIIDVKDYGLRFTDGTGESSESKKFAERVKKSNALIIVSPEYNHGYPGELKIMMDMLYKEYAKKPIGFCGVSIGAFGGIRAVEQLRQVAIEFHMLPIRESVYFSNIGKLFDEKGNIKDETYHQKSEVFLSELMGYAEKLSF